jgi:hypothetical protein
MFEFVAHTCLLRSLKCDSYAASADDTRLSAVAASLFGRYYIRWSFVVFPLWVLLISICILVHNLRRPSQREQYINEPNALARDCHSDHCQLSVMPTSPGIPFGQSTIWQRRRYPRGRRCTSQN